MRNKGKLTHCSASILKSNKGAKRINHLHVFRLKAKHAHKIRLLGIPDEDRSEDDPEMEAGWKVEIEHVFHDVGLVFEYDYDFGDG